MNLLLINHYAGSVRHGMEFRPYYLAREWVRQGHRVTIVAASHSHVRQQAPDTTGAVTEEMIDGIRYVWLRTPGYEGNGVGRFLNMLAFVVALFWNRKKIVGDEVPDAVIASSTYPLDIFPARRFARRYKTRLVFEVHDLWPLSPMELGGMSKWHPFIMLMQWGENYACRHADRIISILPKTLEHLQSHGMSPEKLAYIPNGIAIEGWEQGGEQPPVEHMELVEQKRKEQFLIVGYAGAHGLANALDTLLDAAVLLKNEKVAFVLVGHGPEKERLINRANELSLENLFFLPAVNKQAVPSLLNAMDVLYIGLKYEPLFRFGISPNKLFDYMMAAKPVIQSIKAGNDLVSEANCGISVIPESPEHIVEAVHTLVSLSGQERFDMGMRGKTFITEHHDYRYLASNFLEQIG